MAKPITKLTVLLLAAGLIVSGCMNSIFTKYQDNQCVAHCDDPKRRRNFEQPVLQTLQMFIGEVSCALLLVSEFVRYYKKYLSSLSEESAGLVDAEDNAYGAIEESGYLTKQRISWYNCLWFALPAICDICGTTLMNLGLIYVSVSIYQMIRGALILFVAIFSIMFLKRTISNIEWASLFVVVIGITVVGYTGSTVKHLEQISADAVEANAKAVVGIFLVLLAQVFTATQFVIEEHIMNKIYISQPGKIVALEGLFGTGVTLGGMVLLHVFSVWINHNHKATNKFNMAVAFDEFFTNRAILVSGIGAMFSIAAFNIVGVTVTKKLSATSRSTIDTCRTLLVWLVSMTLGWESFNTLQLFGFALLVVGTLIFNKIVVIDDKYLPLILQAPVHNPALIDEVVNEQIERQ